MAKLKEGVEIRPFGASSLINNENLTDNIALYLLESGKADKEDFEELPKLKQKQNEKDNDKK